MPSVSWNPWHGCRKISAGCEHCYVYRGDAHYGRDPSVPAKTASFRLPVARRRGGAYRIPSGSTVYTCFTSDFLLEEADDWRAEAWEMIRARPDLHFFFVTKRIERLPVNLPPDWGTGYEHVTIACTVENQDRADARLPLFLELPIRHRTVIAAPLLTALDLREYLDSEKIEELTASGESGREARPCHYEWVLSLREQCMEKGIPFQFHQTGANFVKDGRVFRIPRREQTAQARKAGIDYKIEDRTRPLVIPSGVAGPQVEQVSFFEEGTEDAKGR